MDELKGFYQPERIQWHTLNDYAVEHNTTLQLHQYLLLRDKHVSQYVRPYDHLAILIWIKMALRKLKEEPDVVIAPLFLNELTAITWPEELIDRDFILGCTEGSVVPVVELVDQRQIHMLSTMDIELAIPRQIEGRYVGIEFFEADPPSETYYVHSRWPEHWRVKVGAAIGQTNVNIVEVLE